MDLTVIIPTYNESKNIALLIDRVFRVFSFYNLNAEVIVVDDNSPDRTWEVVEELRETYKNLRLICRDKKRGLSSAVLEGIKLAQGNIIGVMDGDLSHPPEKIPELIMPILQGEADFVIGSRYVLGGDVKKWPFKRRVYSMIATAIARGLTSVKDPMSGFFFFKREVIDGIELNPRGFKIGLEILIKGRYRKVVEVPIVFKNRERGESKLSKGVILDYLIQVISLYFCKFFIKNSSNNMLLYLKHHSHIFIAIFFFILTFIVYYFTGEGKPTPYHYFVPLADAFLHGRLHVLTRPPWLNELIPVDGKFYVIYPPMPAILLIPQVLISGLKANQTLASVFWGSVNVSLVYLLMRRLVDNRKLQIWLTFLFGFGTIHWYLASIGKAWFFAHVVSFLFLTLAVYETFGKRRPYLIGLLLGASYWSRLPTILTLPFFIVMLSDKWIRKKEENVLIFRRINLIPLLELGCGVGVFIVLNLIYNYLRFGTPFDIAYSIQAKEEPWFYPKGLFHISYIPKHLWIFFLKPPVFMSKPPYVVPSLMGMSILITTPAFIYSVFSGRNKVTLACWLAIIPVALVAFMHGGVGWIQFGYRFAMDFYPFLLVLTALGMKSTIRADSKDLSWEHKLLICLSILVNLWGVLWINKFGWVKLWG